MTEVLVATGSGCRVFRDARVVGTELPGRAVNAIAPDGSGGCVAVVGGMEIWRRDPQQRWAHLATTPIEMGSVAVVGQAIFGGGAREAAIVRVHDGTVQRVRGFDECPGRDRSVAHGPPLSVRAITATPGAGAILAAVHIGGIPRSLDGGQTWSPTIPMDYDVHEVRAHRSSGLVVAAAAVGLCMSTDGGQTWDVTSRLPDGQTSLAVAVLEDEVLFSVQDGPFASESQVWRWQMDDRKSITQVREGLPDRFRGKVDTNHIAAGVGRAAIVDGGGSLWVSKQDSLGWECIAADLQQTCGLVVL